MPGPPEAPGPRPALGWSDLRGAEVGVWGLGVEGRANVRRLLALGVTPVLVDDRPPAGGELVEGLAVVATAEGGFAALGHCEVVVKTPGISRYRPEARALHDRGIPVVGGVGLWLQEVDRDRVVVVTGTKGKSTTTSVLAHLLNRLGRRAVATGNLGQPPHDPTLDDQRHDVDYWVVEVSSFQATDLAVTPPVAVATSLHPDHLDWHGTVERYFADKLSALSQPGARVTVANGASDLLRRHRARLGPTVRWVGGPGAPAVPAWVDELHLIGGHNRANAGLAGATLEELGVAGADDEDRLAQAAQGFEGLPSRLRVVATIRGVDFVDDSLSTNVLPVMAALDAFADRATAVLVGGFDRGIDYEPLARHLAARTTATLVLTMPDSGSRIADAVELALGASGVEAPVTVRRCDDLAQAVAAGFRFAEPAQGVVLLSPAAPSFGRFRDYRDRAEAFTAAARALVS